MKIIIKSDLCKIQFFTVAPDKIICYVNRLVDYLAMIFHRKNVRTCFVIKYFPILESFLLFISFTTLRFCRSSSTFTDIRNYGIWPFKPRG